MKTEPAFAHYFRLEGDPYEKVVRAGRCERRGAPRAHCCRGAGSTERRELTRAILQETRISTFSPSSFKAARNRSGSGPPGASAAVAPGADFAPAYHAW